MSGLGLDPFLAALLAAPLMFALGFALQLGVLNRTLGGDILPPLLVTFGLSIVIQNGLLETFSADSRRLDAGALETTSLATRAAEYRAHAASDLRLGGGRHRRPQPAVLSHRARPRLPRDLRRSASPPA